MQFLNLGRLSLQTQVCPKIQHVSEWEWPLLHHPLGFLSIKQTNDSVPLTICIFFVIDLHCLFFSRHLIYFGCRRKSQIYFDRRSFFWMGRTSTLIYPPQTLFKLSLYPYYFLHWFLKSLTKAQKSTLSSKAYNTFLLPLLSIHSFSIHSVFKILILLSINGLTHAPYSLRKTYYSILKLRTDEVWTVEHRLFNKDIALFFLCSSSPILRPSKLQFQYRD